MYRPDTPSPWTSTTGGAPGGPPADTRAYTGRPSSVVHTSRNAVSLFRPTAAGSGRDPGNAGRPPARRWAPGLLPDRGEPLSRTVAERHAHGGTAPDGATAGEREGPGGRRHPPGAGPGAALGRRRRPGRGAGVLRPRAVGRGGGQPQARRRLGPGRRGPRPGRRPRN